VKVVSVRPLKLPGLQYRPGDLPYLAGLSAIRLFLKPDNPLARRLANTNDTIRLATELVDESMP
jgi:hypothetical protein